jgi:hypothetical protein
MTASTAPPMRSWRPVTDTSDKKPLRLVDTRRMGDGLLFYTYEFVQG